MRILDVRLVKVLSAVLLLDDSLAVLHGGLGGALLVAEGHGESEALNLEKLKQNNRSSCSSGSSSVNLRTSLQ